MNRKEGLILLWLVFAAILGGSFYGVAQEDGVKRYLPPPPPPAPSHAKGVEPEYLFEYNSSNEKEYYEVYLDKFIVWTTDSMAVYSCLGHPEYVKNSYESSPGIRRMECSIGDVKLGKKLRDNLRKIPGVIRVANYCYNKSSKTERRPEEYVTVMLKNSADSVKLFRMIDSIGGKVFPGMRYRPDNYWSIELISCKSTAVELANYLYETGLFESARPYFWTEMCVEFTYDPYVNKQWGLYNINNITISKGNRYTDLNVSLAWNYATGNGVKICIVDEGFDTSNDDLSDHIKACYEAGTGASNISEKADHGTACAGVAAAIRNNNYGVAGVAPDADLMLASFSNKVVNGKKREEQMAEAINWAWQNGADIISCSWGIKESNEEIKKAVLNAMKYGRNGKGCVIVKSSGNDAGDITFPGTIPGVITVGAVDSKIKIASYSNYGDNLWVVAPGDSIYALQNDGKFNYNFGTSLAAPAVAGVAALVLEAYPEATYDEVRRIIGMSAMLPNGVPYDKIEVLDNNSTIPVGQFWSIKYGFGLVNAYKAVSTACSLKKRWTLQTPEISNPSDLLEHL